MFSRIIQPIKSIFKTEDTQLTNIELIKSKLNYFNNTNNNNDDDSLNKVKQISIWFAMGYCSGITIKKASKVGIVLVGTSFMGLQLLTYYDYININHQKIESEFINIFDLNKDGKVDNKDLILHYENLKKILSFNLPAGGGYSSGLLLGLKNG